MVVINDIFQYSAISELSNWFKGVAITIFISIVTILFIMLYWILKYGDSMRISFGY
ncbi:hypothetical protein H4O18_09465 [Arenibacter sp. BSSL-BM3]|uniref:Uncharacterized protein n=1 Tax=Arenibacter arenosicollis TaxID=2762274 RepID=A0ABR7QM00_9FLAO|nr:hypothetical protein [Arenibacter arenosicollis]MBC8768220.1 hypothetical protein [Arenibacter arenosicollis]